MSDVEATLSVVPLLIVVVSVVSGQATVSPSGVLAIVYFGEGPVLSVALTPAGAVALLDVALPDCGRPLRGWVIVTRVTLYEPLVSPAEGLVLTMAVTPVQPAPEMVTVGGVVYVPPAVTLAKTTRLADGVAVSESVRTGLAVIVM